MRRSERAHWAAGLVSTRLLGQMVLPKAVSQVALARIGTALAVTALGAIAIGALSVGAMSIGRVMIRHCGLGEGRVRRLAIDDLEVTRLRVRELITERPVP